MVFRQKCRISLLCVFPEIAVYIFTQLSSSILGPLAPLLLSGPKLASTKIGWNSIDLRKVVQNSSTLAFFVLFIILGPQNRAGAKTMTIFQPKQDEALDDHWPHLTNFFG